MCLLIKSILLENLCTVSEVVNFNQLKEMNPMKAIQSCLTEQVVVQYIQMKKKN